MNLFPIPTASVCAVVFLGAAAACAEPLWQDPLTPTAARPASTALPGTSAQDGGDVWTDVVNGAAIIVTEHGATVTQTDPKSPVAAAVNLPSPDEGISLEANLTPAGVDWLGLGLSSAKGHIFWNRLALWAFLRPGGGFGIMANQGGKLSVVYQGNAKAYTYNPDSKNHMVLVYDKAGNSVSLTINDTKVVDSHALDQPLPPFDQAVIIFNAPKEADLSFIESFTLQAPPSS